MTRRASALALASESFLVLDETPAPPSPVVTHRVKVRAHRRTVRGPAGPTGEELKQAALDAHLARDVTAAARDYVRTQLAALYRTRVVWFAEQPDRWFVSAEDVADIIDAWADCPAEILALPSQKWRGAIFARGGWKQTGRRIVSKRPGMHSNDLPCWALVEEAAE